MNLRFPDGLNSQFPSIPSPEFPELHVVDECREGEPPYGAVGEVEVAQVRQRVQLRLGQLTAPLVLRRQRVVRKVQPARGTKIPNMSINKANISRTQVRASKRANKTSTAVMSEARAKLREWAVLAGKGYSQAVLSLPHSKPL